MFLIIKGGKYYEQIYTEIFTNYNNLSIPTEDDSSPLNIHFSLTALQILDSVCFLYIK